MLASHLAFSDERSRSSALGNNATDVPQVDEHYGNEDVTVKPSGSKEDMLLAL